MMSIKTNVPANKTVSNYSRSVVWTTSYCEGSFHAVAGDDPGVSPRLSQSLRTRGFDEDHIGLQFPRAQHQDALMIEPTDLCSSAAENSPKQTLLFV